jgi:hypothetical protein
VEHLQILAMERGAAFDALLAALQLVASGRLPSAIAQALGVCTLIALEKRSGGVRPIAIGEAIRRLAGRAMCLQLRAAMAQYFTPNQYGVQTKGGAEQVLHVIEAHLALHPTHVLLRVDCRNAFNSVSRAAFLRALMAAPPALRATFPFVAQWYLQNGALHVARGDGSVTTLLSVSGTQQGDPFGPFLFALAIHAGILRVQQRFAEAGVVILAYLDDVHILGPAADAAAAFKALKAELELVQLEVVIDGKNYLWCPNGDSASFMGALSAEEAALIIVCPNGFVVLGVPVGTDASSAAEQALVDGKKPLADKLTALSRLVAKGHNTLANLLLHLCVAPSVGYVQRCAPPSVTDAMATRADSMIRASACEIYGLLESEVAPDTHAGQQLHLPRSQGGVGLRSAVVSSKFAYFASWAAFGPECAQRWPHLADIIARAAPGLGPAEAAADSPLPDFIVALNTQRSFITLNLNVDVSEADIVSKAVLKLQLSCNEAAGVLARSTISTALDASLIAEQAAGGAAARLSSAARLAQWKGTLALGRTLFLDCPVFDRSVLLSAATLSFAVRRLLSLPLRGLEGGVTCACGCNIDAYGNHADVCPRLFGDRSRRHDYVNYMAVYRTAKNAKLPAVVEPQRLNAGNNGRPADTGIPEYGGAGGQYLCLDVSGSGAAVESYLEQACSGAGGAMDAAVLRKLRNARKLDGNKMVVPMVFDTQGGMHSNWLVMMAEWAQRWGSLGEGRDAREVGNMARCWLVRAATVIQIAQFRVVAALINSSQLVDVRSGEPLKALACPQLHEQLARRIVTPPSN